jgi:hypothetical protein
MAMESVANVVSLIGVSFFGMKIEQSLSKKEKILHFGEIFPARDFKYDSKTFTAPSTYSFKFF